MKKIDFEISNLNSYLMQKGDATSKDLYKLFNNRIKSSLLKSTLNTLISYGEIEFKDVGKSRVYNLTEKTNDSEILQFPQLGENAEPLENKALNTENSQFALGGSN